MEFLLKRVIRIHVNVSSKTDEKVQCSNMTYMCQVVWPFVQWDYAIEKLFCYYCLPPDNDRLSCGRDQLGHHCSSNIFHFYCLFRFAKEIDLKNKFKKSNKISTFLQLTYIRYLHGHDCIHRMKCTNSSGSH